MKQFFFITSVLFSFQVSAQKQYDINWVEAPKNPNAFAFTCNHFGLKGKVSSAIKETSTKDSSWYKWFDKAGFLTATSVSGRMGGVGDMVTEMTYFKYNWATGVMTKQPGDGTKPKQTQKINAAGQIIETLLINASSLYKTTFLYNDKGLLNEKQYVNNRKNRHHLDTVITRYEYNFAKQVVKEEQLENGKLISLISYQYKKNMNQLVINYTKEFLQEGNKQSCTEIWDVNGLLIKEVTAYDERIYEYDRDAVGNWISMTITFKDKNSISTSEKTYKRTLVYD